jgi:hypothetical protein
MVAWAALALVVAAFNIPRAIDWWRCRRRSRTFDRGFEVLPPDKGKR